MTWLVWTGIFKFQRFAQGKLRQEESPSLFLTKLALSETLKLEYSCLHQSRYDCEHDLQASITDIDGIVTTQPLPLDVVSPLECPKTTFEDEHLSRKLLSCPLTQTSTSVPIAKCTDATRMRVVETGLERIDAFAVNTTPEMEPSVLSVKSPS